MDGDDVFVEIKMFKIKSVVALFAGHEVGQDTGGAAIPFEVTEIPENLYDFIFINW